MAARAVNSKSHMTQETEKTLEGLYRYYSYVQLNLLSLLLTSPTLAPTFKCLLRPKFDISGKCNGTFVVRVFALQLFAVIIFIIPEIILDWSANKNMKDADHFFFYAIDLWYPTSPYCKYTLVNISMQ